jgi:spermidine/putrescine transport system substrate-binding protein
MFTKSYNKWALVATVLIAIVLVAAACGDDAAVTPAPSTPTSPEDTPAPTPTSEVSTPPPATSDKPYEGEKLVVSAFSGPYYDAMLNSVVKKFEEETGASVDFIPTWGEELTVLTSAPADQPPWDVSVFGGGDLARAIELELLLPIRRENVPNIEDLTPFFQESHGMGFDNNYAVPFDFGFMAIVYDREQLGFDITSWEDFWRPELQGKIALDAVWWPMTLAIGAFSMDLAPADQEIYDDDLRAQVMEKMAKIDVALWFESGAEATAAMERGDVAVMTQAVEIGMPLWLKDPDRYGIATPPPGAPGFIDSFGVVRGTKKRELGEVFLNYVLDPEAQAQFAEEVPYLMTNALTEYGPIASNFIPSDPEERNDYAILLNWGYAVNVWDEVLEDMKKNVYTK